MRKRAKLENLDIVLLFPTSPQRLHSRKRNVEPENNSIIPFRLKRHIHVPRPVVTTIISISKQRRPLVHL